MQSKNNGEGNTSNPLNGTWTAHVVHTSVIAKLATHGDIVETPVSEVLGVSRLLLRRLGEELRAVEILAIGGHGFQSAAAACNLFEQSHYLTYVGISTRASAKSRSGFPFLTAPGISARSHKEDRIGVRVGVNILHSTFPANLSF